MAKQCRLALLALCLFAVALAARAEERNFRVVYTGLGRQEPPTAVKPEMFVGRLDARPGVNASLRPPTKAGDWSKRPADVPSAEWLALVGSEFGARQNWVALEFNGPQGAVSLAAWRQAIVTQDKTKYTYPNSIPPGPDQIPPQALIELAAEVGQLLARPRPRTGPIVQLVVRPMPKPAEKSIPVEEEGVAQRPVEDWEMAAIEAIAFAAAWRTGLQPTRAKAASRLVIEVGGGTQAFHFDAVWTHAGKTQQCRRDGLRYEALFPGLVAILRRTVYWQDAVSGFVPAALAPIRLLAFAEDRLIFQELAGSSRGVARAVAADTGLELWATPPPERGRLAFTTRQVVGERLVDEYEPFYATLSPKDGAIVRRTLPLASTWAFDAVFEEEEEEKLFAAVSKDTLKVFAGVKEVWARASDTPFDCGPAIMGDRVLVGGESGEMLCLAAAAGQRLLWRTPTGERLRGPITPAGELALAASQEGTLFAFAPASGSIVWRKDFGDALTGAPMLLGGRLIVAAGPRQVYLIEPATGKELKRVERPNLIVSIVALPHEKSPAVACVELDGTVTFLAAADLAVRRQVKLRTRTYGDPLFVPAGPLQWGVPVGLGYTEPVLLVAGEWGVVYSLPIPVEAGGKP